MIPSPSEATTPPLLRIERLPEMVKLFAAYFTSQISRHDLAKLNARDVIFY